MKKTANVAQLDELPKTYVGLVGYYLPRPIHDSISYQNAVEMVDRLAGFELNEEQDDYLDLISQLVASYEDQTVKKKKLSRLSALQFLLEDNELAGDDLAKILDIDRSLAFKILKGRRNLTVDHIRKLSQRFAVAPDLFLA